MSFNNENGNENENENFSEFNENNNNENNNNENNAENRNMNELKKLLKDEFNIYPKNKKFINKLINEEEIDEEMIEKLLNGNSRKMKAFYRWMEDEVGYKKNPKTKTWYQVENNNLNNLLDNDNNLNNLNEKENKKENKKEKKNDEEQKILNKVLKVYFGDKEGYKLTEYENLIKISKNIDKNNSENVIKEKLSKLMGNKDDGKNKKSTNKSMNNVNVEEINKNGQLNSRGFVILDFDNHCILKKVNGNAKLSNYNINKIPEMCERIGINKFLKFLNKKIENFRFITIEKNNDFIKTLKENKKKSLVLFLKEFDAYVYYHQKYLYMLNYTEYNKESLESFLSKYIRESKIKEIEEILCEVNTNSLSCLCLDYLIYLSLINKKVKFKSINKIIKDIAVEISDFILYLCQKRVFS